jgi:hypothetical protein
MIPDAKLETRLTLGDSFPAPAFLLGVIGEGLPLYKLWPMQYPQSA